MITEEMISELVQGMRKIFAGNIDRIILYGSAARHEATAESDIDIAVIVRLTPDDEIKERFIAWAADMDLKYDRVFSIIDIEKEQMERWKNALPFYKNIQSEGIVLWKAA